MKSFRLLAVSGLLGGAAAHAAQLPAFPGAQGFGALATGGRGGEVYHVTNLADAGAGSLRAGVEHAPKPRTIVFDVGGYVALKGVLRVGSDLTIAGQTAPGEGIGIRGSEVSFSGSHNVIVRHVRIRQGLAEGQAGKSAIGIYGGRDLMFDHVSVQWGRWDTVDMNRSTNVTFQDCLIGPGVAPQRFGCLCQCENVSFIRNLWISNQSRNPKAKGRVQYVNNVVYNWGVTGYVGGHSAADHSADLIGNYFIKGPNSNDRYAGEFKPTDRIYQRGNFADLDCDGELNGHELGAGDFAFGAENSPTLLAGPTVMPPISFTPDDALTACRKVIAGAGASLHRDAVDRRLIGDLVSFGKRGTTLRDPAAMGGFGEIAGGQPPRDTDGDGLPDFWKQATGSNPDDADGYTRLERYLNWLAAPHAVTQTDAPVNVDLRALTGDDATNARFAVSRAVNGTITLTNGSTAHFVPIRQFTGLGGFDFTVADGGASWRGTVSVAVSSVPVVVKAAVQF